MRYIIPIAMAFVLTLAIAPNAQAVEIGAGGQFHSSVGLMGDAFLQFGAWGADLAVSSTSTTSTVGGVSSTLSGALAILLVTYDYTPDFLPVGIFLGAGGVGAAVSMDVSAEGQTVNVFDGVASGQQITLGVEYEFGAFPAEAYGGVSYFNFEELEVESDFFEGSVTVPFLQSGISFNAGVRLSFTLFEGSGENGSDSAEETDSQ